MPTVSVKWGKQEYPEVEVDASGTVADLKAILMSLTGAWPGCGCDAPTTSALAVAAVEQSLACWVGREAAVCVAGLRTRPRFRAERPGG
jgi:hypothetical protein